MNNQWYPARHFPLDQDLMPLLKLLQSGNLPHRVTEESGQQCLWVLSPDHIPMIDDLCQRMAANDQAVQAAVDAIDTEFVGSNSGVSLSHSIFVLVDAVRRFPATAILLLLGLGGFLLIKFDPMLTWVSWLTLQPVQVVGDKLYLADIALTFERDQYWRLVTPIFLHFGPLHLIFNSLWVFELGRKIEAWRGSITLFTFALMIGVASNLGQYALAGPSLMGGLSGVVYGLLGFIWIHKKLNPDSSLTIQPGIVIFMLVWLVVGITGAIDVFIDGSVANAAHGFGLLAGVVLALIMQALNKTQAKPI